MTDSTDTRTFAATPDGTRLPVIDVTNPAFAVSLDEYALADLAARALKDEESRGPVQRFLMGLMMRAVARRSRLVAALQAAQEGFLGGIPTYVMKLGPDNLVPPYDTEIDRAVLRSPQVTGMRVRLHQVARLLADALAPELRVKPTTPLVILDIAGGPSADALNALLVLERDGLLAGREVRIIVYDIDASGPAFAGSMLDALKAGPLAGRDINLGHVVGSWSDVAALARVVADLPAGAILAATSEGGLFEYGSDADIAGVLAVLAPRFGVVTGSVTRDDRLNRLMRRHSTAKIVPRGLEVFGRLIGPSGYRVARAEPSPLSDQVLLTRS
jgi:hypothetical protein